MPIIMANRQGPIISPIFFELKITLEAFGTDHKNERNPENWNMEKLAYAEAFTFLCQRFNWTGDEVESIAQWNQSPDAG